MKNVIRQSIKKEAKIKINKDLVLATFILAVVIFIIILISYLIVKIVGYNYESRLINDLIIGFIFTIISPLILGYADIILKYTLDNKVNYKYIFSKIKDFKFVLLIFILMISLTFLVWLIGLIPIVGIFINFVILLLFIPFLLILPFTYLHQKLDLKEVIVKTADIVSGHHINIYGLILSFSFWIILSCITLGILFIYVIPYIYLSLSLLYLYLIHEKEFKKHRAISNGNIIIVFLLVISLFGIFLINNFQGASNYFKMMIYGKVISGDETLSYGGKTVTYDAPNNYLVSSSTDTSKTYINKDNSNILQYSIYLTNCKDALEMDKGIVSEMKNDSKYKNVTDKEFTLSYKDKELIGYKYSTLDKSAVIVYYPKGDFTITISLYNDNNRKVTEDNIKEFITIY